MIYFNDQRLCAAEEVAYYPTALNGIIKRGGMQAMESWSNIRTHCHECFVIETQELHFHVIASQQTSWKDIQSDSHYRYALASCCPFQ